jgi:hypothetical protein
VGCPDDDTLGALVAGALGEREREAVAIHAASCDLCHALLGHLSPPATTADERDGAEELALEPGTEIGRYTIEARIGAGGMGVVFAARDRELERRVALKLLRPGGDDTARARLVREARTLARLSHPNIVTVFDAGEHQGHVFIAMELVDGGSVLAWRGERERTLDEILDCMLDAGRGLAAAHGAGVVHRDVKPDNILVGRDGRARVTDFGLAREEVEPATPEAEDAAPHTESITLTRTGTVLGTPVYMAPEVRRGATSARTDQWAYCATLYELLAGVRPFPSDPAARDRAIEDGRLAPPPASGRVPGAIRAVLARGLRPDPAARWDDMAAVVTALARARRRPRTIAVASVAAALVVAGGATAGALALRGSSSPPPRRADDPAALRALPSMSWRDSRPGCSCPASACAGRCLSQCDAPDYRISTPLPGISLKGRQEALQGTSDAGDVVLFLAGESCSLSNLYLARFDGTTYVPTDLTPQIDTARFALHEGCCTLADDGHTLVVPARGMRQLYAAPLAGDRVGEATLVLDPHLPDDANLTSPVISADGRTIYYRVAQNGEREGYLGDLDGLYQATRPGSTGAFTGWHRIAGAQKRYDFVSGVSADGLSLFLVYEYATRVLVRATTEAPFGSPNPGGLPLTLYGWRAKPVAACQRVLTTITPGGCEQEDIWFLERGPAPP